MTGRAIGYPVAVLIVPAVWWLVSRRRPSPYPYALDILLTLPFLIDTAGNAANLYDTIDWEFLEYYTFIRQSKELRTAYTDTLGDLALGLSGSVLAAVVTVTLLWPRVSGRAAPASPRSP